MLRWTSLFTNRLPKGVRRKRRMASVLTRRLAVETLEDWRMLSATFGLDFLGSTSAIDSGSNPPDTGGAVGINHFVELINGQYSVCDRSDGTRVKPVYSLSIGAMQGLGLRP